MFNNICTCLASNASSKPRPRMWEWAPKLNKQTNKQTTKEIKHLIVSLFRRSPGNKTQTEKYQKIFVHPCNSQRLKHSHHHKWNESGRAHWQYCLFVSDACPLKLSRLLQFNQQTSHLTVEIFWHNISQHTQPYQKVEWF